MLKCDYCGKDVSEDIALKIEGKTFCDSSCRYSFDKNGGKPKIGAFSETLNEKKPVKKNRTTATIVGIIVAAFIASVVGQFSKDFMRKNYGGFKEFVSPDKSFSALLPQGTKETRQRVNTPLGRIETFSYNGKAKHQEFAISYCDYPDSFIAKADSRQILDGARDGAARNIQGRLLGELLIDLNGNPGRELTIEGPQKTILQSRVYLVGKRLYQVMAIAKPDHAYDETITKVFDSFKLLAPVGAPAGASSGTAK